jgi:hypothetical protein
MNIKIENRNQSKIDLSNQNLKEIPKEIFELKNLKKLILRNNKIKIIPAEIEKLKRLETLDLSGNNISTFYAKICTLQNLQILNLNNNQLKNIPFQITNLKKLKSFHLANNKLDAVSNHIFSLQSLRELDISNNKIEIINGFENLKNLKKLWLNNLKIHNFSIQSIINLKDLNALYCFSNDNYENIILDVHYKKLISIKGNCIEEFKKIVKENNHHFKQNIEKNIKAQKVMKKIFVTYAWSDEDFNSKVISFVNYLRTKGFDATLDKKKSQEVTAINFNKMMIEGIANSDKVIVVLNKNYKKKADNFEGGVDVEFQIIFEDIKTNKNKYIFVSFGDEKINEVSPIAIGGTEILDLKKDQDENDFNILFSKIKEEQILDFSEIHDEEVEVKKIEIEAFKL